MSISLELRSGRSAFQRSRWRSGAFLAGLLILGLARCGLAAEGKIDFFESQVRPVLVDHCYGCHSHQAEKVKGGLFLDSQAGVLKGGDNGPALVPGDPDKSLLIKAIRYTDENLQMPPKGKKLSVQQIAALEEWVRMGAPDPREPVGAAKTPSLAMARAQTHWAFRPLATPALPEVRDKAWVQQPIDTFVLAKLESKGLHPSPKADLRTLLRRLTFDLTGLPPTFDEMQSFLADHTPDGYARAVDRLLGSPQYGERWARHWLDVARYADTKGYVFEEERRYPYAYTYRDYVIRAFNEDLPYNQFIIQQIAADQLPLGQDQRPLAALGYLTLGRRFLNNQPDIIDDRIDVVARGLMGLTVTCARCHDHKFDPISTKDYYSLYGVFASCSEPEEEPILGNVIASKEHSEYVSAHQKRLDELNSFRTTKEAEIRSQLRQRAGEYLLAARDSELLPDGSKAEALARERRLDPGTVQRWIKRLQQWRSEEDPVFAPWFALSDCSDADLSDFAGQWLNGCKSARGPAVNPLVTAALSVNPPQSLRELAQRYGTIFAEIDNLGRAGSLGIGGHGTNAAGVLLGEGFADRTIEDLRQVLYAANSPTQVPEAEITRLFDVPSIQKLRALKRKLEELDATHPGAPARAMALQDNAVPQAPHVFLRGNPANPGPEVPRQFLAVLSGGNPKPFQKGSGRLELAEAIASDNNPLTARVLVNRVWLQYFGTGLVRTPSDFGLRSDPPSHPELLDYLAARFRDEGWSLKKLHRWIVLSSTYQQASDEQTGCSAADPANQFIWKMNRRRLDFEASRDSLLAASGQLDLAAGGHSVDIVADPQANRRAVYSFVERQNLPGIFRTFDFASPDTSSAQRFSTTIPQQALYMINSPFVAQQARHVIGRAEVQSSADTKQRVRVLYQILYQREPSTRETELALSFVDAQMLAPPYAPEPPAWQYGYAEYDAAAKRLSGFQPLPHFTGDAWQGGLNLPDKTLGWAHLKGAGGHPGNDHAHSVVRRWVAPRDLAVSIDGTLNHDSDKGDGVQAILFSSRSGQLGSWIAQHGKQQIRLDEITVQKGENLDFVVDCRESVESDAFTWAPVIKALHSDSSAPEGATVEWDSRQDFSGPRPPPNPLNAWEKFAQVLLMANEFVFLD